MKATLKLESGKGFHVVLQPESPEESAECCRLARHFNAFPQGASVPLKLAYVTAEHTGDDVKEMAIGIGF